MEISSYLRHLLRHREPGAPLAREFYTDEAIFALDMDLVFYKEWLFAGHTCELPGTGSYFTLQIGDYPVVVVRGADGVVRAFINSCRHRGARVCPDARGQAPRLVCPYHQWTYGLDGRLFAARKMGEGFDRSNYGLRAVHCNTVAGYVFVCLAEVPPDFAPARRQLEPFLAPHRLDEAKVAFTSTIVEEGNWKLVWENNRECYHCAQNHPELARTYADAPALTGVTGLSEDPAIVRQWEHAESLGLPSRFKLSDDGQMRTVRVPLIGSAVSYTLSGEPAVRRPLTDTYPLASGLGALLFFHYPTSWNHVLADHAISFRVLPIGPRRTQLTTQWLVNRDAVEGVDYDLEELTHVWLSTNDQDSRIVAENQIGVSAPSYDPGPYSAAHEGGVSQFLDWYVGRLRTAMVLHHVA
ncbi:MAG: aromatic ring-hydroxylating dioxygenase subunit alpha [Proteobacteria bacterium]|nr:aromatic ring-hydroxylating dioxygenase subunit alpha [Pseudomonadota bacterium]